jgi:hypothetical protein
MVGSSNIDLIARTPRMPKPGETIVETLFQMGYSGKGYTSQRFFAATRLDCGCLLPRVFGSGNVIGAPNGNSHWLAEPALAFQGTRSEATHNKPL